MYVCVQEASRQRIGMRNLGCDNHSDVTWRITTSENSGTRRSLPYPCFKIIMITSLPIEHYWTAPKKIDSFQTLHHKCIIFSLHWIDVDGLCGNVRTVGESSIYRWIYSYTLKVIEGPEGAYQSFRTHGRSNPDVSYPGLDVSYPLYPLVDSYPINYDKVFGVFEWETCLND